MRLCRAALLLLAALPAAGCGAAYYLSAASGQAELLRARRPLEQVLADPATPESLRQQLLVVDSALVYAHVHLNLPRTDSYRAYADLKRPYVVWAVFAAPEFSLTPRQWCYPFAGCVVYRGWFSEARAQDFANRLASRGEDTYVGGVPAYSTLGWFADPVLNTMLGQSDAAVAGILFHELAHQQLYVPGDSSFNEAYASFVEQEGVRRWLAFRGDTQAICDLDLALRRRDEMLALVAELRTALEAIYGAPLSAEDKRQARNRAFADTRRRYAAIRAGWPGPPWFDGWFGAGLNNAQLAALASYEEYVPAFRQLLSDEGGDLPGFYARAAALGALPQAQRAASLQALKAAAAVTDSGTGACPAGA